MGTLDPRVTHKPCLKSTSFHILFGDDDGATPRCPKRVDSVDAKNVRYRAEATGELLPEKKSLKELLLMMGSVATSRNDTEGTLDSFKDKMKVTSRTWRQRWPLNLEMKGPKERTCMMS